MQKYQVLGVIGQGAYGIVLRCRNIETKEIVAIKKFKQTQQDQIVKKTTMRELKVLRMLNQANIVQLKQAFKKKGIFCLVFQYVPYNLLQVLQKTPQGLQPQTIKLIIYQLMKGLAYLHSLNIIHRDIKPENLLVNQKKNLKICDFGFARVIKKKQQQEELTDYVATRWYRPPQLLIGARYGKQIDIWAVGCIFGELIDGMPMFPGQNEIDQLFLIQKCLGSMTPDHHQIFLKNPRFLGMKFPQITNYDTIQKRYLGKLSPKALNFLKSLLKMDPEQRPTSIEALRHPYFDGIRQEQFIKKLLSNQIGKQQNRIISATSSKEQMNSTIFQKKKSGPPSNLAPYIMTQQPTNQSTIHPNKNGKMMLKKKQETSQNREQSKIHNIKLNINNINSVTTPGHGIHSKSINKNPGYNKKQIIKQKNISLEKHQHRQILAKTQGGFYIQNVQNVIQQQKRQDQEEKLTNYSRNKIYGINKISPKSNKPIIPFHKNSSKGVVSTQQIGDAQQLHNIYQSTGQLPFIVIGIKPQSRKQSKSKQKRGVNIMLNQNTYTHKINNNYIVNHNN